MFSSTILYTNGINIAISVFKEINFIRYQLDNSVPFYTKHLIRWLYGCIHRNITRLSIFIACIASEGEREISRPISHADALVRFRRKDPKVRTRIVCESQVCDARVRRIR